MQGKYRLARLISIEGGSAMKNKHRMLWLLTGVLLTALIFGRAENLFGMVDNTSSLNVRSGPGYSYQIIGRLKRNVWVDILNDYSDWYYITDRNQQLTGYVKSDFIKKASASGGSGGQFVVNNPKPSQFLNLRAAPSYSAQVIGIFYNGASGQILSSSNGWAQVIINGLQGYFREEFIKPLSGGGNYNAGTAYVYSPNGGAVNLRQGPGYSYTVLASYNPGTKVNVHLKGKDFWYISVGNQTGFMSSRFLSVSGSSTPNPPGPKYAVVTNTGKRLNLREGPGLNYRSIGQYMGGTQIYVESQGVEWCKVKVVSNGARGYMMSRYLTLYGLPGANVKRVSHPQGSFVFLRSQPYQAPGTVITRVPHGSNVSVISTNAGWTKVMYGNTIGFMMSYFLK
jgi:uncharacterized protein YgiM (DUF1202 family)